MHVGNPKSSVACKPRSSTIKKNETKNDQKNGQPLCMWSTKRTDWRGLERDRGLSTYPPRSHAGFKFLFQVHRSTTLIAEVWGPRLSLAMECGAEHIGIRGAPKTYLAFHAAIMQCSQLTGTQHNESWEWNDFSTHGKNKIQFWLGGSLPPRKFKTKLKCWFNATLDFGMATLHNIFTRTKRKQTWNETKCAEPNENHIIYYLLVSHVSCCSHPYHRCHCCQHPPSSLSLLPCLFPTTTDMQCCHRISDMQCFHRIIAM